MLVKTVLNHCYSFKRFVYGVCRFEETGGAVRVIVPIVPRKNSKARCSGCGLSGSSMIGNQSVYLSLSRSGGLVCSSNIPCVGCHAQRVRSW